jgi:hypothetical protein
MKFPQFSPQPMRTPDNPFGGYGPKFRKSSIFVQTDFLEIVLFLFGQDLAQYDVLGVTIFILEEKSLEAKKKLGLRSQNDSISHLCILGTYIMHLPAGIGL